MDQKTSKLLDKLDCLDHEYTKYQPDIERDEDGRVTASRVCITCGHVQVVGHIKR